MQASAAGGVAGPGDVDWTEERARLQRRHTTLGPGRAIDKLSVIGRAAGAGGKHRVWGIRAQTSRASCNRAGGRAGAQNSMAEEKTGESGTGHRLCRVRSKLSEMASWTAGPRESELRRGGRAIEVDGGTMQAMVDKCKQIPRRRACKRLGLSSAYVSCN